MGRPEVDAFMGRIGALVEELESQFVPDEGPELVSVLARVFCDFLDADSLDEVADALAPHIPPAWRV